MIKMFTSILALTFLVIVSGCSSTQKRQLVTKKSSATESTPSETQIVYGSDEISDQTENTEKNIKF